MKSMKRVMRVLAIAIMAGTIFVANSEAATITLNPQNQNALVGNAVFVDIMVSLGALEQVGGVSLFLGFNPGILSGVSYTVDPDNAMGVSSGGIDFSGGFNGGSGSPLDLYFLGSIPLPAQGAGFRIATVQFLAVGPGVTPLTFSVQPTVGAYLSNFDGSTTLPTTAVNGSVCVGPNCGVTPVPEPGTLSLMGLGLVLAARNLRRRRS